MALFQRGGRVVGFFPHQRRGGSIQPLAAPLNDYHGVIADPAEAIGLEQVADLLKAPRLSVGGWVGPANGGERRATVQAALPDGYDVWYAERRAAFGKYPGGGSSPRPRSTDSSSGGRGARKVIFWPESG